MKAKFKTSPDKFETLSYVDEFETTTKEIMSEAFDRAWELEGCQQTTQRALAKAFVAAHSISAPATRWKALAEAIDWCTLDIEIVQAVLTRMTRKGYLRSRQSSGYTFYEVNF
jgi:hypothetical protein